MGLLNRFSEMAMIWIGDNWTTCLTLFCWFVVALGLKKPSQPGDTIPFFFISSIQGFFHIRVASLLWWLYFGEIDTHSIVAFLQLVRFRGLVVMKNNETCNALKCLKPSGLIGWVNFWHLHGWFHVERANSQEQRLGTLPNLNVVGALKWWGNFGSNIWVIEKRDRKRIENFEIELFGFCFVFGPEKCSYAFKIS